MVGEFRALYDRDVTQIHLPLFEPGNERRRPIAVGEDRAHGGLAHGRRERSKAIEDRRRRLGGRRATQGVDQARGDFRAGLPADSLHDEIHDRRVGGPQDDEPFGSRDPVRIRRLRVVDRGHEDVADPADPRVERGAAGMLRERDDLALGVGGKRIDELYQSRIGLRPERCGRALGPAAGQARKRGDSDRLRRFREPHEDVGYRGACSAAGDVFGDALDEGELSGRRFVVRRLGGKERGQHAGRLNGRGACGRVGEHGVGERARIGEHLRDDRRRLR